MTLEELPWYELDDGTRVVHLNGCAAIREDEKGYHIAHPDCARGHPNEALGIWVNAGPLEATAIINFFNDNGVIDFNFRPLEELYR